MLILFNFCKFSPIIMYETILVCNPYKIWEILYEFTSCRVHCVGKIKCICSKFS